MPILDHKRTDFVTTAPAWYYDQKSPYLFFLHFESMIYNHLPCQILGHDFNEKSEFLDFELSIKLPAITQLKNGRVQKRSWVEGGCDVIQSRHQNKCGYFGTKTRSARFMFYLSSCVFIYACLEKDYAV